MMHDFYYQKLLDNPENFDPRVENRFLEILDSGVLHQCSLQAFQELICAVGWHSGGIQ